MAMPLRLIYNVKVTLRQKVGLVAVFGLGFVMIAFAIIRAKQVLVEKMFVNLTLLMIWSTLAASICKLLSSLLSVMLEVKKKTDTLVSRHCWHPARPQGPHHRPLSQLSKPVKPAFCRRKQAHRQAIHQQECADGINFKRKEIDAGQLGRDGVPGGDPSSTRCCEFFSVFVQAFRSC